MLRRVEYVAVIEDKHKIRFGSRFLWIHSRPRPFLLTSRPFSFRYYNQRVIKVLVEVYVVLVAGGDFC